MAQYQSPVPYFNSAYSFVGQGGCLDRAKNPYMYGLFKEVTDLNLCKEECLKVVPRTQFRGLEYNFDTDDCKCLFEGEIPDPDKFHDFQSENLVGSGFPQISKTEGREQIQCWTYNPPASTNTVEWTEIGLGQCRDSSGAKYDSGKLKYSDKPTDTLAECQDACVDVSMVGNLSNLQGISFKPENGFCRCHYEDGGNVPQSSLWQNTQNNESGTGKPTTTNFGAKAICYAYSVSLVAVDPPTQGGGDATSQLSAGDGNRRNLRRSPRA